MNFGKTLVRLWIAGFLLLAGFVLLGLLGAEEAALFLGGAGGTALLAVMGYRIILPLRRLGRHLDRVVQDEAWNEACQDPVWREMPFSGQLARIIQGSVEDVQDQDAQHAMEQQATLRALQSQINPHFLYNTLECIRGQALIDGNRDISRMLEALGSFFQYSISRRDHVVPLYDELENVKGYMLIQNYRFSNRYVLEIDFLENEEELLGCYVPKLMLQPLVENSLLHGFENKSGGTIRVTVDASDSMLLLTVSDDGDGMSADLLQALNDRISGRAKTAPPTRSHGNGIALPNINRRIQMLFGKEYSLHAYSTPGGGTDMEIVLPRITRPEVEL